MLGTLLFMNSAGEVRSIELPRTSVVGGSSQRADVVIAEEGVSAEHGPDWCGSSIGQCGCAMTSVANAMTLFELVSLPDGEGIDPATLNAWFNLDAEETNSGWVSRGYVYGDVVWTAVNTLSAQIAAQVAGVEAIEFKRSGTGSDEEIRGELEAGRPIILEVPGHWIAAIGLDGETIRIKDPFYPDRTTLDVYAGKVISSILFETSDGNASAVVVTVPAGDRVRVTDSQGRVVGTHSEDEPLQAVANARNEIPGASIQYRDAWRDPTCAQQAPPEDAGTIQITLPEAEDGGYQIEVIDADDPDGETSVAVHTFEEDGSHGTLTHDHDDEATITVAHDADDGDAGPDLVGDAPGTLGGSEVPDTPEASPTADGNAV